jgi:hypothetical protein
MPLGQRGKIAAISRNEANMACCHWLKPATKGAIWSKGTFGKAPNGAVCLG